MRDIGYLKTIPTQTSRNGGSKTRLSVALVWYESRPDAKNLQRPFLIITGEMIYFLQTTTQMHLQALRNYCNFT